MKKTLVAAVIAAAPLAVLLSTAPAHATGPGGPLPIPAPGPVPLPALGEMPLLAGVSQVTNDLA